MTISIETLHQYSTLQNGLLSALGDKYRLDGDFLVGLPRSGNVEYGGASWCFSKHGRGVRFTNNVLGVVDSHSIELNLKNAFDSWGLMQYLESMGSGELEERDIVAALVTLEIEGVIHAAGEQNFYVVTRPA